MITASVTWHSPTRWGRGCWTFLDSKYHKVMQGVVQHASGMLVPSSMLVLLAPPHAYFNDPLTRLHLIFFSGYAWIAEEFKTIGWQVPYTGWGDEWNRTWQIVRSVYPYFGEWVTITPYRCGPDRKNGRKIELEQKRQSDTASCPLAHTNSASWCQWTRYTDVQHTEGVGAWDIRSQELVARFRTTVRTLQSNGAQGRGAYRIPCYKHYQVARSSLCLINKKMQPRRQSDVLCHSSGRLLYLTLLHSIRMCVLWAGKPPTRTLK